MILGYDVRQERFDKEDLVFHIVFSYSECDEQNRDVCNGDVIWDGFEADDRRILHTDAQESGEDSLEAASQLFRANSKETFLSAVREANKLDGHKTRYIQSYLHAKGYEV